MAQDETRESLEPGGRAERAQRRRIGLQGEFALALLPTVTVLVVLGAVQALTRQKLLFASLASSAFLIYLDPEHGTNSARTLILAQTLAALLGWAAFSLLGPGFWAGGVAMVAVIALMILLDAVHPPAVSTALSFALKAGSDSNLLLFGLALGITVVLVGLERAALWILARYSRA